MSIREFDGTDDYIAFGGLGTQFANSPRSVVGVIKPMALSSSERFINVQKSAGGVDELTAMVDGATSGFLGWGDYSTGATSGPTDYTASDWQILGVDKASGTVLPRAHRKIVASGSWTHTNMAATKGDFTDAWDATLIARLGSLYKNMRIAVAALFNKQLSDADYVTIGTANSTQSIYALGPITLWEFNQASTATAVNDLVGSLHQTTIVGTTVIEGDDPAWTFGVTVTPGPKLNLNVQAGVRW